VGKLLADDVNAPIATAQANLTTLVARLTAQRAGDMDLLSFFNLEYPFAVSSLDTDLWTSGKTGTGTASLVQSGDLPPMWALTTSGAPGDNYWIKAMLTKKGRMFTPCAREYNTVRVDFYASVSSNADVVAQLGLVRNTALESPTGASGARAVWMVDGSEDSNWRWSAYKAAVVDGSSDVTADTIRRKLSIVWTQTNVKFYLNDSLIHTESAQVPNVPCGVYIGVETTTAAAKTLNIELARVRCYTA